jgi:hypothetical protein
MLGGYGKLAGGEVTKTFADLPPHTMIRVVATFHFIDAWNGETGFMRLGIGKNKALEYVWNDSHDFSKGSGTISVCGARYPENRLSTPIDVMAPHIDDFIEIGFGSTLDQDPYENSFGVSGLQIFVR